MARIQLPESCALARVAWGGALVVSLALLGALPAAANDEARRQIIVKFKADGANALLECAEKLDREGRRFASASARGSDSLDRLQRRMEVRRVRALFRRPDGRSFAAQRQGLRSRLEAALERPAARTRGSGAALPELAHVYTLELASAQAVPEAVALFQADPHVEYAQPNYAVGLDFEPNDPHLRGSGAWGQPYEDLWGLRKIRVREAWDFTLGEGVVVGIVDTGLDFNHRDIADNVWVNPGEDLDGDGVAEDSDLNGVDDDGNGFIDDLRGYDFANSRDINQDGDFLDPEDRRFHDPADRVGHGTHVTGTIAAVANNGLDIAGVAPRARVMAVKAFPAGGEGASDRVWRAVLYAAENGAQVINASFSCTGGRCPSNPVAEDVIRAIRALGTIFVGSAGNRTHDVLFQSPERLRDTLVVGAIGFDDSLADFSNFGFLVDVVAPGGGPASAPGVAAANRNILSLRAVASDNPLAVTGQLERRAGTSMSTPHVTGLVALLLAHRPDLDYEAVRSILRRTVIDLGDPGHDQRFGAGLIDAGAALAFGDVPDLRGAILAPEVGATLNPPDDALPIRGSVTGSDLRDHQLAYGIGPNPSEWIPLTEPSTREVEEATLGVWQVGELEDGAYVLRLRMHDRDGHPVTEFVPVSIERNPPTLLSAPGPGSFAPSVSGPFVAWHSTRAQVVPDPAAEEGIELDVFLSEWHREPDRPIESFALTDAPGNQQNASVSGNRVAWLDTRRGATEIWGCQYEPGGTCHADPLVAGPALRRAPFLDGNRMLWTDDSTGVLSLVLCTFMPGSFACFQQRPVPNAAFPATASLHADRLFWVESRLGPAHAFTCVLDPDTGQCPDLAIQTGLPFEFEAHGAGRLVSFKSSPNPIEPSDTLYPVRARSRNGRMPTAGSARNQREPPRRSLRGPRRVEWSAAG